MLQGDVDDLYSYVRVTNIGFGGWKLSLQKVVVKVACSTAVTDAKGVSDGHITALVRASRQGYCKPRRSGRHHHCWEEDEHQAQCFFHS
jgi:hypothetical protein